MYYCVLYLDEVWTGSESEHFVMSRSTITPVSEQLVTLTRKFWNKEREEREREEGKRRI